MLQPSSLCFGARRHNHSRRPAHRPPRASHRTGAGLCRPGLRWCGQLPEPWDGGGESDNGKVVSSGLLEAGGDAAELLELAEAALDQMALRAEVLVEGVLAGAGRVVGDDSDRALGGDRLGPRVGILGGIGHDDLGGQALDQGVSLRIVAALSAGQGEAHGSTQTPDSQVDLGAQATAGAAKGLIFSPPFLAPAACWWARMMVLSPIRYPSRHASASMRTGPTGDPHDTQIQTCRVTSADNPRHPPSADRADPPRRIPPPPGGSATPPPPRAGRYWSRRR